MAEVRPAPGEGRLTQGLFRKAPARASLACAALAWAAGAIAGPSLSLAEAERIAIDRDAVLQQLAAESSGMQQQAIAAGQLADPRLRFGAVNVPVDSWSFTQQDMTMVEVGVTQEFPAGRTRELARQRLEQVATASQARAGDRRRVVQREVRRVWVELGYVAAARREITEQESWAGQMREAARARYASGGGKQVDLLQAGLEVAMLRERQLDLDRDETTRRAELARWLGEDDAARAGPFSIPARSTPPSLPELEQRLTEHPTQLDYERRIDAAQTAVKLAEQSTRPGWMLDLGYGFRGGEMNGKPRSDLVTAMVSVDLPFFRANRQDREIEAARAEAQGLHDMHLDHQRELRAELEGAWGDLERTGELERFYETDLVPLADQTVEATLLAYRNDRASLDEVVRARRVSLETHLKHLRLAADRAQAQYELDYLAGESP